MIPSDATPCFDNALCAVADLLADARNLERSGYLRAAERLYARAEAQALRSGFLELMRLVWAYLPARRDV